MHLQGRALQQEGGITPRGPFGWSPPKHAACSRPLCTPPPAWACVCVCVLEPPLLPPHCPTGAAHRAVGHGGHSAGPRAFRCGRLLPGVLLLLLRRQPVLLGSMCGGMLLVLQRRAAGG